VQWVRQLVRALAAEGRTVFLSSHLMSEMSQTADHLLVIGRGRIIADGPVQQVTMPTSAPASRTAVAGPPKAVPRSGARCPSFVSRPGRRWRARRSVDRDRDPYPTRPPK
jgi:ABC-type glutathione transport system ATPase component